MEPAEASWGFLREEPSAKAKSQPLRQGAEPCPERGLFADAVEPNWDVEIPTEKGKEEEQGTRKVGQPSGSTETGRVGTSEGACAGVLS